jgi:hypothetical protein
MPLVKVRPAMCGVFEPDFSIIQRGTADRWPQDFQQFVFGIPRSDRIKNR